jgi:hypothetical protein
MSKLLLAILVCASTLSAQSRERKIGDVGFVGGMFSGGGSSHVDVSARLFWSGSDTLAVVSIHASSLGESSDYVTVSMSREQVKLFTDSVDAILTAKPSVQKGETMTLSVSVTDHSENGILFGRKIGDKDQLSLFFRGIGGIRSVLQRVDEKGARKVVDLLRRGGDALDEMTGKKAAP